MIKEAIEYIKGGSQKKHGRNHGKQIAECENHEEISPVGLDKKTVGSILLSEIKKKKNSINDESNCIKCRRTPRDKCKKHERIAMGLDHLAGDIAQEYLDMQPKYLEDKK
jgi:hypothetical protein